MTEVKAEIVGDKGQYVKVDDMTFPNAHGTRISEVEWTLRHAPDQITRGDQLLAASVIAAYRELVIFKTAKERNYVCSAIKYTGAVTGGKLSQGNASEGIRRLLREEKR